MQKTEKILKTAEEPKTNKTGKRKVHEKDNYRSSILNLLKSISWP